MRYIKGDKMGLQQKLIVKMVRKRLEEAVECDFKKRGVTAINLNEWVNTKWNNITANPIQLQGILQAQITIKDLEAIIIKHAKKLDIKMGEQTIAEWPN